MRFLVCFFVCLFGLFQTKGQQKVVDGLPQLLVTVKDDSNKVKLLQKLGFQHSDTRIDSNFLYQQQALHLAKKIRFNKGEITSLAELGFIAMVKGDYPVALELSFNAKQKSIYHHYDSLTAEIDNNIGLCYYYMGDFFNSKKFLLQAKALLERNQFEPTNLLVSGNLGRTYLKLNNLDSALFYCSDAYRLINRLQLLHFQPAMLRALGEVNEKSGNDALAFAYYQQSGEYAVKSGSTRQQTQSFYKLAEFYYKRNISDSALLYARQALEVSQDQGFLQNSMEAAGLLADIYNQHLQSDSAYKYLSLSVRARNEMYNQEKQSKIQSLSFLQILNDLQMSQKIREAQMQRKQNIQYSVIALAVLIFIILYFLFSHSIVANSRLIRSFGVILLLIFFEFLNLFLHPYLATLTHHSPAWMLLIMVCIATLLVPLHHRLEHLVTNLMVDKNKRIRLKAAKKMIEELDDKMKV